MKQSKNSKNNSGAKPDRIPEIIRLEKEADEIEHDIELAWKNASEVRWQAASLIWAELKDETTIADIAKAIGKSISHVFYMRKCWDFLLSENLGEGEERPYFNTVYNSKKIREGKKKESPKLEDKNLKNEPEDEDLVEAKQLIKGIQSEIRHRGVSVRSAIDTAKLLINAIDAIKLMDTDIDRETEGHPLDLDEINRTLTEILIKLEEYETAIQ